MPALVELLGAERVCFGSDYPHAEGLAEPLSWLGEVAELDARAVERIVSANMYELLGIERRRPAARQAPVRASPRRRWGAAPGR